MKHYKNTVTFICSIEKIILKFMYNLFNNYYLVKKKHNLRHIIFIGNDYQHKRSNSKVKTISSIFVFNKKKILVL